MVWWVLVEPPQQVSLVVAPPGNQKVSGETCPLFVAGLYSVRPGSIKCMHLAGDPCVLYIITCHTFR